MSYKEKYLKYKSKYLKEKTICSNNRIKIPKNEVSKIPQETFNKMVALKYAKKEKILNPDTIKNEKDFIDFIRNLSIEKEKDDNDLKKNSDPYAISNYGWENNTIVMFLEAITAGYEDRIKGKKYDNIWTKIANIIYLGKVYE